jgi:hypothetical protein
MALESADQSAGDAAATVTTAEKIFEKAHLPPLR